MTHLSPNRDCVSQPVGDELVILDTGSGRYYRLNASARVVYEHLLAGGVPESAGAALCAAFAVDGVRAAADAARAVEELRGLGLLTAGEPEV